MRSPCQRDARTFRLRVSEQKDGYRMDMPIDQHDLELLVATLRELADPRRILLFGSHARGDARTDSDIDLMVIVANDVDRRKVGQLVRDAIADRSITLPIEPIFRTEAEFERRRHQFAHLHWIIDQEGRELYAA
jgi:predicted nucleotidyltransferase